MTVYGMYFGTCVFFLLFIVFCLSCFLSCLSCLVFLVLSCLVLSCLVLSCLVLSCLVLSCLVLSCLVLFCFVLFHVFVFEPFCFLFFVSYRNESIPTLIFKSRNYLTCFRHHLNTTRSGTRMQWSKRSERHRAHMYCSPWYWRLMTCLPGSLVAPSPSRTMLSHMLVSLTSIPDTLSTYHLLLQPQQFRTSLATCLNSEDSSPLSAQTSGHSSKT